MQQRKKVFLAYTELLEYRISVFENLADHYELTVCHSGKRLTRNDRGFEEIVIPAYRVGRFRIQPRLRGLIRAGTYDAVIFFMDLAWLDIVFAFLLPPYSGRRITWGLWRTGRKVLDRLRLAVAKRADCNVFYSQNAADDFCSLGLPASRIAVAVNSLHVRNPGRNPTTVRDCILVVGSFNQRKQNDVTVAAFAAVALRVQRPVRLIFVGKGPDQARIMELAANSCASDLIEFRDASHDDDVLREYYDKALCSVSFGQAGLSVLQSFAYGVPFITRADAITGGERENIRHGLNGILCENSQTGLEIAMESIIDDEFSRYLGSNASIYYQEKASVRQMIGGFVRAVDGAGNT